MKTLVTVTWMAMAVSAVAMTLAEQDRLWMEAVQLNQKGSYAEAELRLKQLLEAQTDWPGGKELLAEVQGRLKAQREDPARLLARRLETIILPEVKFREAGVKDVVLFLEREAAERSSDKKPINFVWLVPAEAQLPRVTLTMRQAPLSDVLGYVTRIAGLRYRVDGHAVAVYQPEPVPATKTTETK